MPDAPIIELRPRGGRPCDAKTRSGGRCKHEKGWGTDHPGRGRCKLHNGSTAQGKAAAAMEAAREAVAEFKSRVPFYGNAAGVEMVHPFQVILDNVHRSNMAVIWLEGIIQGWGSPKSPAGDSPNDDETVIGDEDGALSPSGDGKVWPMSYRLPDSKDLGLGVPLMTVSVYGKGGTVHDSEYLAFLRLYHEERKTAVAMAKMAIDANLEERMTRLSESLGIHIRTVIEGTLTHYGLPVDDDVAVIVRQELLALNAKLEGTG